MVTALLATLLIGAPLEPMGLWDLSSLTHLDLNQPAQRRQVWDTLHLAGALQGLANRDSARLYLRFVQPSDDYWLAKMRTPGEWLYQRPSVTIENLDQALRRYERFYKGAVVYDPDLAASSLLASTVAGCESLLPVRFDPAPDSLYTTLVASGRLPVGRDLRGVAKTKTEAYAWAKAHYLVPGGCDPRVMAYYVDQFWLSRNHDIGHANHTLTNHDYFIAHRGFFFDLLPWDDEAPVDDPGQAVGSDFRTLSGLLRTAYDLNGGEMIHVGGFVPWAWKYTNFRDAGSHHEPVPTEWRYAQILSSYNAFMDADALGPCGMANASFYQHFPLRDHYPQPPRPTDEDLVRRGLLDAKGLVVPGTYLWFYVGDYDAAAWLYNEFPKKWDDPSRGSVPLGWALNPNLQARMAPALHYAHLSASANDWFVAGDSGAGYINPGELQEPRHFSGLPSGLPAWERWCGPLMRRWDLGIVGFVIDGYAPAMNQAALDTYARIAPEGIAAQKIERVGLHGAMPFVRMTADLDGTPEQAAGNVAGTLNAPGGWQFLTYRTVLHHPGWHRDFADALKRRRAGENVQAVDPYTFFRLAKRYAERRDEHRLPPWPEPSVHWSAADGAHGVELREAGDGPFELVERDGVKLLRQALPEGKIQYVYFAVNDRYRPGVPLVLTVQYRDGTGRFAVEYDSTDAAYTALPPVTMGGTGQWKTARFELPKARLENGQNSGADLRLINFGTELIVRSIEVGPR